MQRNGSLRGPLPGRIGGALLAGALRALPEGARYDAAAGLARAIAPWIGSSRLAARLRPSPLDSPDATALALILNQLHRLGVTFRPRLELDSPELIREDDRGILVLVPYSRLNSLGVRFMYERHPRTVVVAAYDQPYGALGSRAIVPHILAGPRSMLAVRRALEEGALVAAMIETDVRSRRTVEFTTVRGPMAVDGSLVRLAALCGARLCFGSIALGGDGALRYMFRAPESGEPRHPARDVAAYVAFVQARAAERG